MTWWEVEYEILWHIILLTKMFFERYKKHKKIKEIYSAYYKYT